MKKTIFLPLAIAATAAIPCHAQTDSTREATLQLKEVTISTTRIPEVKSNAAEPSAHRRRSPVLPITSSVRERDKDIVSTNNYTGQSEISTTLSMEHSDGQEAASTGTDSSSRPGTDLETPIRRMHS